MQDSAELENKDDNGTPGPARTFSGNRSGRTALISKQRQKLGNYHSQNRAAGKEGETKHRPRKRRNGGKTTGHSEGAMLCVEPLLWDDREIDKYTRPLSKQGLSKHVLRATNRRTTIEVLLETWCFCVVRAEELSWRQSGRPSQFTVLYGIPRTEDFSAWSWRISMLEAVAREPLVKT
jgi:hypothetical protein